MGGDRCVTFKDVYYMLFFLINKRGSRGVFLAMREDHPWV